MGNFKPMAVNNTCLGLVITVDFPNHHVISEGLGAQELKQTRSKSVFRRLALNKLVRVRLQFRTDQNDLYQSYMHSFDENKMLPRFVPAPSKLLGRFDCKTS